MTQRDAAKALGRTPSYVAKSENGERRVDIVELLHFARIYRRSLRYFATPLRAKH
jgi:transcriptional regulator with XRE-family HTH domain